MKRRCGRAGVAVLAVVMGLAGLAYAADSVNNDQDYVTPGNQQVDVGPQARGVEFQATIQLRAEYAGNQAHLPAGEPVVLELDVGASSAGVSATDITLDVPDPWGSGDVTAPGISTVTYTPGAAEPAGSHTIRAWFTCKSENCIDTGPGNLQTLSTSQARVDITYTLGPLNTEPVIAWTANPSSVDESSTVEHTYSFAITDPDDDTWTFVDGYPTCGADGSLVSGSASIDQAAKTGTFECIFDDGPATTTVAVQVSDGTDDSDELTHEVAVANVPPTATLTRVGPANVLTGTTVTYDASATDPSAADTVARFHWSFNDGAFGGTSSLTSSLSQTYTTCGTKSESVRAKDKDGGVSAPATAGVEVWDGGWHGAIKPAVRNMVQKGRVVPVQIRIGCDGAPLTGLAPAIVLLSGDVAPGTADESVTVLAAVSVSAADTSGVMRETDEGYIYNLALPKDGSAGQKYTIRVRPWGGDGATLQAVLEVRK